MKSVLDRRGGRHDAKPVKCAQAIRQGDISLVRQRRCGGCRWLGGNEVQADIRERRPGRRRRLAAKMETTAMSPAPTRSKETFLSVRRRMDPGRRLPMATHRP